MKHNHQTNEIIKVVLHDGYNVFNKGLIYERKRLSMGDIEFDVFFRSLFSFHHAVDLLNV